jgi:hypothetical protein
MISAEALAFLRGPQPPRPDIVVFFTDSEGQSVGTADAFLHVEGGTYNALAKGVVIGRVQLDREDHGRLSEATGLPVHNAIDWSRLPDHALAVASKKPDEDARLDMLIDGRIALAYGGPHGAVVVMPRGTDDAQT